MAEQIINIIRVAEMNIKKVIPFLFFFITTISFADEVIRITALESGELIAKASQSRYLLADEQKILTTLLLGSEDYDVSVQSVNCTRDVQAEMRTCIFSLLERTPGDEETSYKLKVEFDLDSTHLLSAVLNMGAG